MGKRNNRSRGRNRSGNRSPSANQSQEQTRGSRRRRKKQIPFDPEKHYLPEAAPEREYEPCPLSGEEIENIYTAIADPHSGRPARFDKVVEQILATEEIGEDERLAYIGRGAFGIVSMQKGETGRQELVVRKRIQFEDSHETYQWRRELAPGISRDYRPEPKPLSDLYSPEEISQFPRFDGSGSVYVSRSN